MRLSLVQGWDPSAAADVTEQASAPLSFDDFFQANHHRLFAALCLTTGDRHEAEEIAQDAFVRILERWSQVAGLDDPVGYLYVTAMNVFRRRYRRAKLVAALPLGRGEPPEDAFDVVDARDALIRVLRDLSPRQRAAIVLTTILDLSSEEAARILHIKDSTVRVLAKRARDEMRSRLGDER